MRLYGVQLTCHSNGKRQNLAVFSHLCQITTAPETSIRSGGSLHFYYLSSLDLMQDWIFKWEPLLKGEFYFNYIVTIVLIQSCNMTLCWFKSWSYFGHMLYNESTSATHYYNSRYLLNRPKLTNPTSFNILSLFFCQRNYTSMKILHKPNLDRALLHQPPH